MCSDALQWPLGMLCSLLLCKRLKNKTEYTCYLLLYNVNLKRDVLLFWFTFGWVTPNHLRCNYDLLYSNWCVSAVFPMLMHRDGLASSGGVILGHFVP